MRYTHGPKRIGQVIRYQINPGDKPEHHRITAFHAGTFCDVQVGGWWYACECQDEGDLGVEAVVVADDFHPRESDGHIRAAYASGLAYRSPSVLGET